MWQGLSRSVHQIASTHITFANCVISLEHCNLLCVFPGASGCQPTCVHDQVAHTSTASLKAAWPASAPSSKETNASSAKDSHAFKSAEAPSSKRAKVFTSHRTDTPLTDKATGKDLVFPPSLRPHPLSGTEELRELYSCCKVSLLSGLFGLF